MSERPQECAGQRISARLRGPGTADSVSVEIQDSPRAPPAPNKEDGAPGTAPRRDPPSSLCPILRLPGHIALAVSMKDRGQVRWEEPREVGGASVGGRKVRGTGTAAQDQSWELWAP